VLVSSHDVIIRQWLAGHPVRRCDRENGRRQSGPNPSVDGV